MLQELTFDVPPNAFLARLQVSHNGQLILINHLHSFYIATLMGNMGNELKCKVFQRDTEEKRGFYTAVFSPDDILVAACNADVEIWNVESGVLIKRFKGHSDRVWSIAFTRDGNGLVTGYEDGTLNMWDLTSMLSNDSNNCDSSMFCKWSYKEPWGGIRHLQVSHSGQWIVFQVNKSYQLVILDVYNVEISTILQFQSHGVSLHDLVTTCSSRCGQFICFLHMQHHRHSVGALCKTC